MRQGFSLRTECGFSKRFGSPTLSELFERSADLELGAQALDLGLCSGEGSTDSLWSTPALSSLVFILF